MLFWITLANIFLAVSYAFLSAWVGVVLGIVSTFRTICFIVLEKYRNKTPRWLDVSVLLVFLVANCVATFITWSIWFEFVLLFGALLASYGFWSKGEHQSRLCTVVFSSLLIAYDILVNNWIAMAVEISVIISITVYYSRRVAYKNKKLPAALQNDIIQP